MTARDLNALPHVVHPNDLAWWLEAAPEMPFKVARTMPDVPHSYVVKDKTLFDPDYTRAFGVLRTWSVPGRYWRKTNLYLHDEASGVRWWLMSRWHWQSGVLNRADDGRMYGRQDAPDTRSPEWTPFDAVGAYWDEFYRDVTPEEERAVWGVLVDAADRAGHPPTVLDLGAGTGGTIDAGAVRAPMVTAVDPSQAMLNDLVMKHPQVRAVHAIDLAGYLQRRAVEHDVVVATYGAASHFSADEVDQLRQYARSSVVLSFYRPGYEPLLGRPDDADTYAAATRDAIDVAEAGHYVQVTIPGGAGGR